MQKRPGSGVVNLARRKVPSGPGGEMEPGYHGVPTAVRSKWRWTIDWRCRGVMATTSEVGRRVVSIGRQLSQCRNARPDGRYSSVIVRPRRPGPGRRAGDRPRRR